MNNKRILPSIGLEGIKEELLEFLADFEINKIAISFVDDYMVFTASVPVSDEMMDIYKQAYGINSNSIWYKKSKKLMKKDIFLNVNDII